MLIINLNNNADNVVKLNDVYFNKYTYRLLTFDKAYEIIQQIDEVDLTKDMLIKSKFTSGLLDLSKLSTGCKAILNIVYNEDKCFDIDECGINALSLLYSISKGNVYVKNVVIPLDNIKCDIQVKHGAGNYYFKSTDDFRDWYSEVI